MKKVYLCAAVAALLAVTAAATADRLQPSVVEALAEGQYPGKPTVTASVDDNTMKAAIKITLPTKGYNASDQFWQQPSVALAVGDIEYARVERYDKADASTRTEVYRFEHGIDGSLTPGQELEFTDDDALQKGRNYVYVTTVGPVGSITSAGVETEVDTHRYPAYPADCEAVSTEGKAPVVVTFTTPRVDIAGRLLEVDITKAEILKKSGFSFNTVASFDNPVKGETLRWEDNDIAEGETYTYRVKFYTPLGDSRLYEMERGDFSVLVGPDKPRALRKGELTAVSDAAGSSVSLSWLPVTVGAQGGYVKPDEVAYDVYLIEPGALYGKAVAEGLSTTSYTHTHGYTQPALLQYYVVPSSPQGSPGAYDQDQGKESVIVGPASAMPFAETFPAADFTPAATNLWILGSDSKYTAPSLETTFQSGDTYIYGLSASEGLYGKDDALLLFPYSALDGAFDQWARSPRIDMSAVSHPVVAMKVYERTASDWTHTLRVEALAADNSLLASASCVPGDNSLAAPAWVDRRFLLADCDPATAIRIVYSTADRSFSIAIDNIAVIDYPAVDKPAVDASSFNAEGDTDFTLAWTPVVAPDGDSVKAYEVVADGEVVAEVDAAKSTAVLTLAKGSAADVAINTRYASGVVIPSQTVALEALAGELPVIADLRIVDTSADSPDTYAVTLAWTIAADEAISPTSFLVEADGNPCGEAIAAEDAREAYEAVVNLDYDRDYTLAVRAFFFGADIVSTVSNTVTVSRAALDAIHAADPDADASARYFDLRGLPIARPIPGTPYIRLTPTAATLHLN